MCESALVCIQVMYLRTCVEVHGDGGQHVRIFYPMEAGVIKIVQYTDTQTHRQRDRRAHRHTDSNTHIQQTHLSAS